MTGHGGKYVAVDTEQSYQSTAGIGLAAVRVRSRQAPTNLTPCTLSATYRTMQKFGLIMSLVATYRSDRKLSEIFK